MRRAARSILALVLAACAPHGPRVLAVAPQPGATATGQPGKLTTLPPPPPAEGVFPCSDCHANLETNFTPRALETHTELKLVHGERERWCFDCHDPADRDKLHLAGGTLLPLSEAQRLCGQCHGDKLRDWRSGVHGKRIGFWNGEKQALQCPHCHEPHAPRFKALAPLPPPTRPDRLRASR